MTGIVRRLGPSLPIAEADEGAPPTITPAINLDSLCEALDTLPDEARWVSIVTVEEVPQFFWAEEAAGPWHNMVIE